MEYIEIPPLKKKVGRIGLGTWAIGGWLWGGSDEKESIKAIHKALDNGITLIDTAPVYGFGASEEIVGKALESYGNKERAVIATKVGLSWTEEKSLFRDSSSAKISEEVEASLKRLKVDAIDLYQVHWPDDKVSLQETAVALKKLLDQGKIKAIGVSNFSINQMDEFQKFAPLHTLQPPFNLFEREIESDLLPYCLKKGIAILGYGALCRGLLSGKLKKDTPFKGDDVRKVDPKFKEPLFSNYLECVEELKKWAENRDKTLLALAIRYCLDKGITVPLWGARKPEQLDGLENAFGWKLSENDLKEIDQIVSSRVKSLPPSFMAPPSQPRVTSSRK